MDSIDQLDDFAEGIKLFPSSPIAITCCVCTFRTSVGRVR